MSFTITKTSRLSFGSRRECDFSSFISKTNIVYSYITCFIDFQEPIAAALLGTCILRQLAKKIPIDFTAKPEDFEKNANEFEELAVGVKNLIEYCNICK